MIQILLIHVKLVSSWHESYTVELMKTSLIELDSCSCRGGQEEAPNANAYSEAQEPYQDTQIFVKK